MNLFELTDNYLKVKQLAEEGADEQLILDTLESIEDEIEVKADGYAAVIRMLNGNVETIDKEIRRLNGLKRSQQNAIERMKSNLYETMKHTGKEKLKTKTNSFYVQKNPVQLVVEKEEYIPSDYFEVTKKLDKKKLKEYLQTHENEKLDGVYLAQSEGVRIR